MVEKEFAILVASMKAIYTAPGFLPDKQAIRVWFEMLKDLPYETAAHNLQRFIQTETRYPMPADLRRVESNEMSANEAWSLVFKAVQNSNYNSEAEFNKLPEPVRRAVGTHYRLKDMASDPNFNLGVESSNFMRDYRTALERTKHEAMICNALRISSDDKLQIEVNHG